MSNPNPDDSPSVEAVRPFSYTPANGANAQFSSRGTFDHSAADAAIRKAHETGVSEGQALARANFEQQIAEARGQILEALRSFSKERQDYFTRVEMEVVRLSLSIARKILHRESQLDPLVLTGVVHVALEKLNKDTKVVLRTHHGEVRAWNDYLRRCGDIFPGISVMADPSLASGHCVLDTDFGSTEISLETQLTEIEQGFFDLLEQRAVAKE